MDDANDIARQFAKKKRSLGGVVKLLVFFGGKFFYDRRTTVVPAGAAIVYLLWTKAVTLGLLAKLGGLAFLGYLAYRILQARSLVLHGCNALSFSLQLCSRASHACRSLRS